MLGGILMLRHAIRTNRHNAVLFSLRKSHDEMLLKLVDFHEEGNKINQEQTLIALNFIKSLEGFCTNFNEAKTYFASLNNFTIAVIAPQTLKKASKKSIKNKNLTTELYTVNNPSPEFLMINKMYRAAIYGSFVKLIPLFRFKLGVILFTLFAILFALIGIESFKKIVGRFKLVNNDTYGDLTLT